MTDDLMLRRKWTLRAHGRQVIFVKKRNERSAHVLMKAFLWALYLPRYPDLAVEIHIGERYKPDVVQMDAFQREPVFWGEAGVVGRRKLYDLARKFRHTHFALAKWDTNLDPVAEMVRTAVDGVRRTAPFDLLRLPSDAGRRFIDADSGEITIYHDSLEWVRIGNFSDAS